ncbi:PREDICTED: protein SRG1-like [Populus euphratica]|uniref:Protein SRG1-like n=1 Tax=Populus euphratica TaxID=75702 RepID=A0AAJ6TVV2_POPEU|nr:PREDICTED: protein SRG1-like [Populus euphratica]
MADNLFPTKIESKSKSVQELVMKNEEPPGNYFYEDGVNGVLDSSLPVLEMPVIDISRLTSPSTSREEVEKLHSALISCGCFMSINHGITAVFLDQVRSVTAQFFALPMEEKLKFSRAVDSAEGYGNDMILSEDQILDWTDRLYLILSPEDQRQFKFWPEKPEIFREILQEYTTKLKVIVEVVLKAMARSLNLEDNCFLDMYGERALMQARFNLFPPCPRPDRSLGLKPHSDGSAITIVLQDKEVEGLQFLKDDQWFRVPIQLPHALLINVGDQSEVMSNGFFKSPVHRVVTNSERERTSVAVFCSPDPDNDIEPVDGAVSETRPRLYKKVQDYGSKYFQYYQEGKRAIEAVKI